MKWMWVLVCAVLVVSIVGWTQETQTEPPEEKPVRYMFVQNAVSGSLEAVEGREGLYTLILKGIYPHTIAFSDRPERMVGQVPLQQFVDGFWFTVKSPPNAAIEILKEGGEGDVAVVELYDPLYLADNGILH